MYFVLSDDDDTTCMTGGRLETNNVTTYCLNPSAGGRSLYFENTDTKELGNDVSYDLRYDDNKQPGSPE